MTAINQNHENDQLNDDDLDEVVGGRLAFARIVKSGPSKKFEDTGSLHKPKSRFSFEDTGSLHKPKSRFSFEDTGSLH